MNSFKGFIKYIYYSIEQLLLFLLNKNISRGYIFMLHRVAEKNLDKLPANENMKVSPRWLDSFIESLEGKYEFIRVEEIPKYLCSKHIRPFVAFTMDDGYKDNLTQALPVFKKHNIPYTIFLATDFLDGKAILWWYALEDLILSKDTIVLSDGSIFKSSTISEKQMAFMNIRKKILQLNQLDLEKQLNALFSNYCIDWQSHCEKLCLSWEDVVNLKDESLVTLGAHTMHHYNLKALPTKEMIKEEVEKGWQRLMEMADLQTTLFAFPFGSSNEAGSREFDCIKDMNNKFTLAVRAIGGPVTEEDSELYSLPRIMLTEDFCMRNLRSTHKYIL